MKVTVFRPKLASGLGSPKGFIGDDHPTEGDWLQSAKSDQSDGMEPHVRLQMMARDFLIRSMYHIREPRFIGFAVENYGAACEAMGYSLPLRDDLATWPHYEPFEVDHANNDDYRWMIANIARVFGAEAATKQARALGMELPTREREPPRSE